MISAPNRPICLVRYVPNMEPAPPSFYLSATPRPCSSISMRSLVSSSSETSLTAATYNVFFFVWRNSGEMRDDTRRLHHLDGLRGIAAFIVVVFHYLSAFVPALTSDQTVNPYSKDIRRKNRTGLNCKSLETGTDIKQP